MARGEAGRLAADARSRLAFRWWGACAISASPNFTPAVALWFNGDPPAVGCGLRGLHGVAASLTRARATCFTGPRRGVI